MSFPFSVYRVETWKPFDKTGNIGGEKVETVSLKTLAERVLRGNRSGNVLETQSFPRGKHPRDNFGHRMNNSDEQHNIEAEEHGLPRAQVIEALSPCPVCHENAWWLSTHGVLVCGVCHPPAVGALKKWMIGQTDGKAAGG